MRLFTRLSFAVLIAGFAGSVNLAHATPITLDVSAALKYGGTITGTITFNSTNPSALTGYDLTASSGPGSPGFTFPGFTYTTADSSITAETSSLIQFDSDPAGDELRLVFSSPLTSTGDTLTANGYESEIVAGNRSVTSGSVTPLAVVTPEPSSLLLFGTGLLGALGVMRKRFV
ncbi:MAG TPA: PEP-CTERM sorting domain-containing protein [Terracidiphilus sp.]|jgi:hypothetical protein